MRTWFRKRRSLVAIVTLGIVAATAFAMVRGGSVAEEVTTFTTEPAETGTLSVTVAGSGNAFQDATEVWPDVAGEIATVAVSEGETVAAGDVLFTILGDDLDDETTKLLASYQQALEGYERSELSVMQAEAGLDDVDVAADKAYVGYLQALQSFERAELEVDSAQAAYDQALAGSTLPTPTASAQDVAQAATQLEIAETGLEAARVSRDSAWDEYQEAISDAADDSAQQNLVIANAGMTSSASSLESARVAYEEALADYDGLVVTAPHDGIVSTVDIEAGDTVSAGDSGTTSSSGSADTGAGAPITLADNEPLSVEVEVNEVDIPGMEAGQKAEVIFDAMPELTFSGEVTDIDDQGTNSQGVVTFFVRIELLTDHDDLRAGMTAQATIVTAIAQDALLVPNAAIQTDSDTGSEYVEVLAAGAGEPTIVPVQTGLYSATHTVIESGLAAGDPVVTSTDVSTGEDEDEASGGSVLQMPGMGGGRP